VFLGEIGGNRRSLVVGIYKGEIGRIERGSCCKKKAAGLPRERGVGSRLSVTKKNGRQ